MNLRKGDVRVTTRGNVTALAWKHRRDVYILTNMDPPPKEGNFSGNSKRAVKPQIVAQYNRHMGYIDISDRMANSYSMCQRNFKWTTKLFFHLLHLTELNSSILLSSSGGKCTQSFQTSSGEEFDRRSWKKSRSPYPQFGWKAKCGCSRCYETGQPL